MLVAEDEGVFQCWGYVVLVVEVDHSLDAIRDVFGVVRDWNAGNVGSHGSEGKGERENTDMDV